MQNIAGAPSVRHDTTVHLFDRFGVGLTAMLHENGVSGVARYIDATRERRAPAQVVEC